MRKSSRNRNQNSETNDDYRGKPTQKHTLSMYHPYIAGFHIRSSYGRWLFLAKLKSWDGSCLYTSRYERLYNASQCLQDF